MKNRDLLLIALLIWLLTRKKQPETTVSFPGEEVLKICPGGWTVPYEAPCPPTT